MEAVFLNLKSQKKFLNLNYFGKIPNLRRQFLEVADPSFSRYKVMNVGVTLMIFGRSLLALHFFKFSSAFHEHLIFIPAYLIYYLGIAFVTTNYIQFGFDQLLFEPSNKLQSYVYWIVGLIHLPRFVVSIALVILTKFIDYDILQYSVIIITNFPYLLLVVSLFFICYCKRSINIEPPQKMNPFKHIYKVMKYAWFNKYPVRRSAYTYTERPSRLDLCKERYGGPFTTEQVEDVKSFWRILSIALSMFGVFCFDTTADIARQYYHQVHNYSQTMTQDSYNNASIIEIVTVLYPTTLAYGSACVCVFLMQLVYVPLLSRHLRMPKLIIRMGVGLFLTFCSSFTQYISTWNFLWLISSSTIAIWLLLFFIICNDHRIYCGTSAMEITGGITWLFYYVHGWLSSFNWYTYFKAHLLAILCC